MKKYILYCLFAVFIVAIGSMMYIAFNKVNLLLALYIIISVIDFVLITKLRIFAN